VRDGPGLGHGVMLLRWTGPRREIVSPTASPAPRRPLAETFSTGAPWLSRALTVSFALHALAAVIGYGVVHPSKQANVELVDIEIAPPPPPVEALPAETQRPPESAPQSASTLPGEQPGEDDGPAEQPVIADAGVDAPPDAPTDAPVDAAPRKRRRPDAATTGDDADVPDDGGTGDAGVEQDAAPMLAGAEGSGVSDAGAEGSGAVAAIESGSGAGSGTGEGAGAAGSGVAAATEQGSGSGVAGMDTQPAVDGAPTSAGTAANLLAYFPPGHVVTALVRFDRLRKTEWAAPAERLFRPMPDYQALFGERAANVGDSFDTLVISSPRPRDATATTLVVHSTLTRPQLRDYLTSSTTPIAWSAAKGGMLGTRSGQLAPNDKRVLLSPWRDWVVLSAPDALAGLTAPAKGSLDTIEAKGKLPPWLQTIRTIEKESGDDKRGPALVLTLAGPGGHIDIPDVGVGITSLPSPQRISLAMELTTQGWFIRGNIVFGSEADAKELETSLDAVKQRILDSKILSSLLRKQRVLNLISNLSLNRTGARVSYSTSMSIADARALLAAAAVQLDAYFASMGAGAAPDGP